MSESLPTVYLARHGETAWSLSGQHTGLTDLPLTERGEANARTLGERLRGMTFALVLTSPLQRATTHLRARGLWRRPRRSTRISSNGTTATTKARRTAEILKGRPGWQLFRDGCPGGESPSDVGARADRVIARARAVAGDVLVFSSGHILRVLGCALARVAAGRRPVFPARNRQPERAGLRA